MKFTSFISLVGSCLFAANAAAQVSISAGGVVGGALPRSRGSECFLIAPAHVVVGGLVAVTGSNHRLAAAVELRRYGTDVSVLRSSAAWPCVDVAAWSGAPPSVARPLEIRLVDPAGRLMMRSGELEGLTDQAMDIRLQSTVGVGWSGAGVYQGDRLVGMAIALVDGRVRALTTTYLRALTATFFTEERVTERWLPRVFRTGLLPSVAASVAFGSVAALKERELRRRISELEVFGGLASDYEIELKKARDLQASRDRFAIGSAIAGTFAVAGILVAQRRGSNADDRCWQHQTSVTPTEMRWEVRWRF